MFNIDQFRTLLIRPALQDLQLYSEDAEELLVFICAAESMGGTYLHQVKGPAIGIYQMEPTTYNDIWVNYIHRNPNIASMLFHNFDVNRMPSEDRMIYDLRYATAMARLFFMRIHEVIPYKNSIVDIWIYYKKYYNTPSGKAVFTTSYDRYKAFIQYQTLASSNCS